MVAVITKSASERSLVEPEAASMPWDLRSTISFSTPAVFLAKIRIESGVDTAEIARMWAKACGPEPKTTSFGLSGKSNFCTMAAVTQEVLSSVKAAPSH